MRWTELTSQGAYYGGEVLQPLGRDCASKLEDEAQRVLLEKIWGCCRPVNWDGVEGEVKAMVVEQCLGREKFEAAVRILPLGGRRWGVRLHKLGDLTANIRLEECDTCEEAVEQMKAWRRLLNCGIVPHPAVGRHEHADEITDNY